MRREKLEKIKNLGIDPFGQKYEVSDYSADIESQYSNLSHEELESKDIHVSVAGRIMFIGSVQST